MGHQTKGIIYCSLSSALCLGLFACLIASSARGDFTGATRIFSGKCGTAGNLNVGIHLGITVVALLVALSTDFFARLVIAPQPDEIRAAHHEAEWLDIGVNSFRNLRLIQPWRRFTWVLAILSSIPLQLFFHASIISTATSTDYNQLLVGKGFLEGGGFEFPGVAALTLGNYWRRDESSLSSTFQAYQINASSYYWTRLDSLECRRMYLASPYGLRSYRSLLIVIEAGPDLNASGWTADEVWSGTIPPYYNRTSESDYSPNAINTLWSYQTGCFVGNNLGRTWNLCSVGFGYNPLAIDRRTWTFVDPWTFQWIQSQYQLPPDQIFPNFNQAYNNITALFCLAEPYDSPCKVLVLNWLLFAVCMCVLAKCVCSIVILCRLWNKTPVRCLGDAIQIFLREDDASTTGLCTYGQSEFWLLNRQKNADIFTRMRFRWTDRAQSREWTVSVKKWGAAIPVFVWGATYIPILCVLMTAIGLLAKGINSNSYAGLGPLYVV